MWVMICPRGGDAEYKVGAEVSIGKVAGMRAMTAQTRTLFGFKITVFSMATSENQKGRPPGAAFPGNNSDGTLLGDFQDVLGRNTRLDDAFRDISRRLRYLLKLFVGSRGLRFIHVFENGFQFFQGRFAACLVFAGARLLIQVRQLDRVAFALAAAGGRDY